MQEVKQKKLIIFNIFYKILLNYIIKSKLLSILISIYNRKLKKLKFIFYKLIFFSI